MAIFVEVFKWILKAKLLSTEPDKEPDILGRAAKRVY
jgi:hypothetical protein